MNKTVCHCNVKENAEIVAKILDYDIEGKIAGVAEIVRCKDCMHYKRGWCLNEEMPICGDDMTTFEPDEDFWCKYGERKDEVSG